jgi:threonine dehydratase
MNIQNIPSWDDIIDASLRISGYIHRTPVLTSNHLNSLSGSFLFFKCENFQKVGAFKARGALNAVLKLSGEHAASGVATHSSGNHAAALALAASIRNIPAYIVMPSNAPKVKVEAVRSYGGIISFCEPTLAAREEGLNKITKETGAVFIPPYNHPDIICGQGTAAKEFLEEIPDLDVIMAPVGGGGLLSGTAIAAKAMSPDIKVIAGEPENANDAFLSFTSGQLIPSVNPQTIADGLKTSLGDLTFKIILEKTDAILTVSEDEIIHAMRLIWERMKIIIEPSCAVPFAAVLANKSLFEGKKVGIILSGGNVDLDSLPWL